MNAEAAATMNVIRRTQRNSRWATVVAVALAALLCLGQAHATLIAYDDFESYTPGSDLNTGAGGIGWTTDWTAGGGYTANDVTAVSSPNLNQLTSIEVTDSGGTDPLLSRSFTPQTGTLYLGLQLRMNSAMDDSEQLLQLFLDNGGGWANGVSTGLRNLGNTNPIMARSSGTTDDGPVAAVDTTYQIVMKVSKSVPGNYDTVQVFIDQLTEGTANASVTADSNVATLSRFNMRTFSFDAADAVYLDELRVATTYAEALALIPEPSTVMLLACGGWVLVRAARRRKR